MRHPRTFVRAGAVTLGVVAGAAAWSSAAASATAGAPATLTATGAPAAASSANTAEPARRVITGNVLAVRGKPGSGVMVSATVPPKVAVGETVTVRLQISGVTAPEGATVEVRDPATRTTLMSARVAAGEQKTLEVPYTGRADGMQFLDVATAQGGRSSVQSVPVRVGSGEMKLKPEGQRGTTSSGETVISLPAASPGASR
jgi:hypothetical protein